MIKIAWVQIFATLFQLITSTAGACSDTNVGVRDELKVIPDGQMTASTNNGAGFTPELGRLHGADAWCPDPSDMSPYLQIDLGQNYDICAVEVQGRSGAVVQTDFTVSFSTDGSSFVSSQVFTGSASNGDVADFHALTPTIVAHRYVRFEPNSASICLRVEIYGTPDGVDVTCNENDMRVQIELAVHTGLVPANLRLIDSGCGPSSDDASFINFIITVGTCDTEVVISSDRSKYFYRNEIIENPSTKKFDIICSYTRACRENNVGVRDELKVIENAQMTASTNNGAGFTPELGRLHGADAWCPASGDSTPHLQIDLGVNYVICGVEVQGKPNENMHTTSFTLESSNDGGMTFNSYLSGQTFTSATPNDGNAADFHELDPILTTQFIRFKPVSASICLRVEVYGTPEGVTVTCNENDMQVQINTATTGLTNATDLQLNETGAGCTATDNDPNIDFGITLGTCGTTVVISSDGVKSFYRNTITEISTGNKKFDIICSYIRQPTEFTPGIGSFSFAMNIFSDAAHTPGNEITAADGPISLGTMLYFKVDVQSSDSNTELHLIKCLATTTNDAADPNGYTFINNGCDVESDNDFVTGYDCAKTDNFQTFTLSVFRFAGSSAGSEIYFHCDAVVCLISNSESVCNTDCNSCTKRKRRTVRDDSQKDLAEAHLVLGPYKIIDKEQGEQDDSEDGTEKGEDPTEAIKDSENFPSTLVAVVCVSALVAIAIIIGLLVMVRLSKSARGPAVKDVTADLARDNLAFEDLEIKTLSIKSNEKPI